MELGFGFTTIAIIIAVLYLLSSIKILAEYERGVIFRLGRLLPAAKGPGIILVFAPVDRMVRVSLRQEALEVPPQDIITRDNVTLKVNAVIFLRVIEPRKAVVEVSNYVYQTSQFAQTTLRSVLGEQELDELLSHREKIQRGGQASGYAGIHAARHGETSGGGARKTFEDHPRGRRVLRRAAPGGRRPSIGHRTGERAIALFADVD
jgi:regulator of protease activity HflC (stomatin/prohibitin superfamily)